MLALAADVVLARADTVYNPHYKSMGLYGSEYWTYSLPRAVGQAMAKQLTEACLPISALQALQMGMVQEIGPRCPDEFGLWLLQRANGVLTEPRYQDLRQRKLEADPQLMQHCRNAELEEMHMDMVQNRKGFAEKCRHFVYKRKACCTPERLIEGWAKTQDIALVG